MTLQEIKQKYCADAPRVRSAEEKMSRVNALLKDPKNNTDKNGSYSSRSQKRNEARLLNYANGLAKANQKDYTVTYSFPIKAFNKEEAESIISQKLRGITMRRLISVKEGK